MEELITPEEVNERMNEQEIPLLLDMNNFGKGSLRLPVSGARGKDEDGERDLLIVTSAGSYQFEYTPEKKEADQYKVEKVRLDIPADQALPFFHAVQNVEAERMRRELRAIKWLTILAVAGAALILV